MVLRSVAKGKRVRDDPSDAGSSSLSPVPEQLPPVKKSKRAQTKRCPVCEEPIPVRLLAAHAELELQRVDDILGNLGSSECMEVNEEGLNSRPRRSFLKARKSLSAMSAAPSTSIEDTLAQTTRVLRAIIRHRKQRQVKLREVTEEGSSYGRGGGGEGVCPVCLEVVRGDVDVVEAHVDSCLAYAGRVAEEREREDREDWEELDVEGNGDVRVRVTDADDFRGTGFSTRDRSQQDVDEEIDVDGDDASVFGDVQFTERDVLCPTTDPHPDPNEGVQTEEEEENRDGRTLRDLVAEGKVVRRQGAAIEGMDAVKAKMEEVMGVGEADKMNSAVDAARKRGDKSLLVVALDDKIKHLESIRISSSTSLLCRICLDPYTEPTVSTGCWHTCCRDCWLRCLGSTKLCPMCKRITGTAELRRIYL